MTYHRVCNYIYTMCATSGTCTTYPSGAPTCIPCSYWCSCCSIFNFMCMFCRSLFVVLYFLYWPLCCLFFFDIRTPLVSSNSSYVYKYSTRCWQSVKNKNEKKLARSFDLTFRYIDNAFSLNISKFDDIVDPTDTTSSVSYRIWESRPVKIKTLRQKRVFPLSHC
jgi:hypothetical protein